MRTPQKGQPSSRVFIGLPAYNEEEALPGLLAGLHRAMRSAVAEGALCERVSRQDGAEAPPYEIIVVDDGSTDGTAERLRAAKGPVFSVHHDVNQNLGGAMRSLLRTVVQRAEPQDVLVCMDADNTFDPGQVIDLVHRSWEGADLVIASRYVAGGGTVGVPWYRQLTSLVANGLFRFLFPIPGVSEYTCSFRAYRVSLLQEAALRWGDPWIEEDGFTSMPEILLRISTIVSGAAELPVCIRYDHKVGPSKMSVLRNVRQTLGLMRHLRRNPPLARLARPLPPPARAEPRPVKSRAGVPI